MTFLLEARRVTRNRPEGDGQLLDSVSIGVSAGDRVAIVGPSGAGKTLLLRSLAMLDPLDGGQILWQGRSVHRDAVPSFRSSVLYLHQRAALLEDTVEAALRRPLTLKVRCRRHWDRQRARELLERLDRDVSFLEKRVGDLSGGEIQITALVRALQLDPAVLLLDEPTAALDPRAAESVEDLLAQWILEAPEQRAFLWVSHNTEQASRVARKSVAMEGGRVKREER